MKKTVLFLLLFCLILGGCARPLGDASDVEITIGESHDYAEADIQSAMDVVIRQFPETLRQCTLKKLWYDEEKSHFEIRSWAGDRFDADEIIVLLSDFLVWEDCSNPTLNAGQTYEHWNWVLTRNKDTSWQLVGWGY